MSYNLKWLAQSTIYRDSVDLLAVVDNGTDRDVVEPVTFTLTRVERHAAVGAPTMELSPLSAQSLMQALWDAGVRPNNGAGSGAEVSALKDHIRFAEGVAEALLTRVEPGFAHNGPASREP